MAIVPQIITNRRNARKSTGPHTPDPSCLKAQNKPNLPKDGNAPSSLLLTTNDQRLTTREAQNKPNSNPIQTQTNPIGWRRKMNVTSLLLTTNDQRLATREAQNKPNSNPIQTQTKPAHQVSFLFSYYSCLRPKTIIHTACRQPPFHARFKARSFLHKCRSLLPEGSSAEKRRGHG
jgi:hypothetical protein